MNHGSKSEAEIKSEIIDILDPARLTTDYNNMTLDDLKKILDAKTNEIKAIKHDDFQVIYDMPVNGYSKSNEVITLKNRVMKQNAIIEELRNIINEKDDELIILKSEYEKLKKQKSFKSEVYEEGSFAAFVAAREAEEDGDVDDNKTLGSLSASPKHSLHPTNLGYVTPIQQVGQLPPQIARYAAPYMNYTPSRRTTTRDSSPFSNVTTSSYNGFIDEKEAINHAIRESEKDAEKIIDAPFERTPGDTDPFNIIDSKFQDEEKNEDDDKKERSKYKYSHLSNRPTALTDSMLDELVDILISKQFEKIKPLLSSWPVECSGYIRLLTYGSETFKQMMVSKSMNIHRCITG